MLKQTIQFTDFNGKPQEKDLYFNLTEWELTDMQASSEAGIEADMQLAIEEKDMRKLLDFVKMLVNASYGERDADGIHFNKSPEITQRFVNSAMYGPLLLSLFQEEGARTTAFITGLMPPDLVARAIAATNGQGNQPQPEGFARPQDFLPKQEKSPGISEAPVIGRQEFQAPITPTTPQTEEFQGEGRHAFEGNSNDAPTDAPPLQVGVNSTEDVRTEVQPFRVKEEPIPDVAVTKEAADMAEFRAWQQARESGNL